MDYLTTLFEFKDPGFNINDGRKEALRSYKENSR